MPLPTAHHGFSPQRFRDRRSHFGNQLKLAWRLVNWRNLRVTVGHCPLCQRRTAFLKLNDNHISIRCTSCRASAIVLSIAAVLAELVPTLRNSRVYELSSRGAFYSYLRREAGNVMGSEYFDDVEVGQEKDGVLCQDVERLTFKDECFDVCTSTEVFEHVADDLKGFSEIYRVLKPGGLFVFTVPLSEREDTVERARKKRGGSTEHLLPAEYHGDTVRGWGRVLVYRDYGQDIVSRLRACGFDEAEIRYPSTPLPWKCANPVVVGYKN